MHLCIVLHTHSAAMHRLWMGTGALHPPVALRLRQVHSPKIGKSLAGCSSPLRAGRRRRTTKHPWWIPQIQPSPGQSGFHRGRETHTHTRTKRKTDFAVNGCADWNAIHTEEPFGWLECENCNIQFTCCVFTRGSRVRIFFGKLGVYRVQCVHMQANGWRYNVDTLERFPARHPSAIDVWMGWHGFESHFFVAASFPSRNASSVNASETVGVFARSVFVLVCARAWLVLHTHTHEPKSCSKFKTRYKLPFTYVLSHITSIAWHPWQSHRRDDLMAYNPLKRQHFCCDCLAKVKTSPISWAFSMRQGVLAPFYRMN